MGVAILWTNFNPLHQRVVCAIFAIFVEICSVLWRREFQNLSIFTTLMLFLLGKGLGGPRMISIIFGWNGPYDSGEEDKNVKNSRQRRRNIRTREKFWSEKLTIFTSPPYLFFSTTQPLEKLWIRACFSVSAIKNRLKFEKLNINYHFY